MPAPTGNKNAQRWTPETTLALLRIIDHYSTRSDVQFIGEALDHARIHKGIWSYWRAKWSDHAEIMHMILMIEQRFENKIISAAMNRRQHAGMAQLMLRNNYGYSKTPKVDHDLNATVVYEPDNILDNLAILPPPEALRLAEHMPQVDMTTISLVQKHAVENVVYEHQKKVQ